MNLSISPVSPSFTAKTSIIAPENLISKKAAEALVEAGSKIGDDRSHITLAAVELNDKAYRMMQDVLIVSKNGNIHQASNTNVPKAKCSAEDYAKNIMQKLANLFE